MKNVKLSCPKCGARVKIDSLIISQFEQSVRTDLEKEYSRKQAEYSKQLEKIRLEVQEQTRQESYLKIKEKDKLISDLKNQLGKVREKLESSSQQLSGEVQELELESILASTFPTDQVIEVGKGMPGADCTLRVCTQSGVEIGNILFESKRVKSFSEGWITKLKKDNLKAKCQVTVIVTSAMPKDIPGKFGVKDGVWVCIFEPDAIRQLTLVLRYGLLKVYEISKLQKNSENKADKLYMYLTSDEFKNIFESVLKGFNTLEQSYQDEKKKLTALWKIREQHLQEMLSNTLEFYGAIKGIAQDIPDLNMLKAG
jgi:hypothetical protein